MAGMAGSNEWSPMRARSVSQKGSTFATWPLPASRSQLPHFGGPVRGCSESYAKPQPSRRIDRVTGCVTWIAHDQAGPEIVTQTLVCGASRISMSTRQFWEKPFGTRFGIARPYGVVRPFSVCPAVPVILRFRECPNVPTFLCGTAGFGSQSRVRHPQTNLGCLRLEV
jgi:hypothetical protein